MRKNRKMTIKRIKKAIWMKKYLRSTIKLTINYGTTRYRRSPKNKTKVFNLKYLDNRNMDDLDFKGK